MYVVTFWFRWCHLRHVTPAADILSGAPYALPSKGVGESLQITLPVLPLCDITCLGSAKCTSVGMDWYGRMLLP